MTTSLAEPPTSDSPDLALSLAVSYPPLGAYCPHLTRISLPQAIFLLSDCREAVYGGAARGGKSDALLMAALQYVDVPGYSALVLRRTFPELTGADGLLARSHTWLQRTSAHWNGDERTWTFPSGATLRFGHVKDELDKFKYDGQAYQFVGFDELTSFTESQYDHIGFTRMSRSDETPVPLRTRGSCTPTGIGYGWVKRRFITHRAADVLFVPAKVRDNPGVVAAEYEQGMERVDPTLRRRLLDGDWDAFEGAAYPWDDKLHVIPPFDPPADWERFESLDHGTDNPTCVLMWTVDYDGNLIVFDSYYAGKRLVSQHAVELLERRKRWWPRDRDGWPVQSVVCYADPSMWSRHGHETQLGDPASVATEYLEHGVEGLAPANNDRAAGRLRVAERLKSDPDHVFPEWHRRRGEPGAPRLFVVGDRCPELVEQLQAAPLLPVDSGKTGAGEIVDPSWEGPHGHAAATARYGAMSRPQPTMRPDELPQDPRSRMLARISRAERDEYELEDTYGY